MKSTGPNKINLTPTRSIPSITMLKFVLDELEPGTLEIYNYPVVEAEAEAEDKTA